MIHPTSEMLFFNCEFLMFYFYLSEFVDYLVEKLRFLKYGGPGDNVY